MFNKLQKPTWNWSKTACVSLSHLKTLNAHDFLLCFLFTSRYVDSRQVHISEKTISERQMRSESAIIWLVRRSDHRTTETQMGNWDAWWTYHHSRILAGAYAAHMSNLHLRSPVESHYTYMISASHWSLVGCWFDLRLGISNSFSEVQTWRTSACRPRYHQAPICALCITFISLWRLFDVSTQTSELLRRLR